MSENLGKFPIINLSHLFFDLTILGQSQGENLKRSWQVMLGAVVQVQAQARRGMGMCRIQVIERESTLLYLLPLILG
jgi:hypothetical protein